MTTYTISIENGPDVIEEIGVGSIEIDDVEKFVTDNEGEIIERGDGYFLAEYEWGNGEGVTVYRIEAEKTITPHKGGRDQMISLRLTQDEINLIDRARGDMSRADYIMLLVASNSTLEELGTPWAEEFRGSGRLTGRLAAEPTYMASGDVAPNWSWVGFLTQDEFEARFQAELQEVYGRQEERPVEFVGTIEGEIEVFSPEFEAEMRPDFDKLRSKTLFND